MFLDKIVYAVEGNDVKNEQDENADGIYEEMQVPENGYAQIPVTPEKDGSVFKYWKKDGEKFALTVEGDGEKHIIMPNGECHIVTEPKKTLFCAI